ncbi:MULTISPECIES: hypothetical protein [unclassified Microbacterium]|uniref:hypothetical protein n=1 Tax=unclassified Microbacterium TaxID=2609290 RepID=UPI002003D12B|nr:MULTISPECIES: hypothetical protein [unclassified Microbacterium]
MTWGDADGRRAPNAKPRRRVAAVIGTVAVVGAMLAGCVVPTGEVAPAGAESATPSPAPTSQSPAPSPRPTPSPTPSSAVLGEHEEIGTGTGSAEQVPLAVPRGTRSILIDLVCDGDAWFTAEIGDSMMLGQSPLGGRCDGSRPLAWPWDAASSRMLMLTVGEGVDWTASVTYSTEPFPEDEVLTAECDRYSKISSEVTNADDGFGYYAAFGEEEWNTRIDAAAWGMTQLAESAQSALADDFAAMAALLAERSPIPGGMTEVTEYWEVQRPITEACSWNHSELITYAEFGG